jgi:uncharacterized LabA/DUF88 family protein
MQQSRLNIAVFIDFDNIEIGVKSTLGERFDVGAVLEAVKERGEVVTKIAYGDWTRAGDYSRMLTQHAVRMVQRNLTPGGDKNGADINLALDAMEMAFAHHHINAFVIVGGDSDFITLVEKLKQYDKVVFVVGGRGFTSQIMQKNCHEFIAYENVVGRRPVAVVSAGRPAAVDPQVSQAMPLVRRALKVLADREVSPQLGLLKSTLLQLDSTFSERNYGASTFRDFVQKLANAGYVSLRGTDRSILVELRDGGDGPAAVVPPPPAPAAAAPAYPPAGHAPEASPATAGNGHPPAAPEVEPSPSLWAEGVRAMEAAFHRATGAPRWPMYLRNLRQFLRSADESFDERRYGFRGMIDAVRQGQREGLFRVERDRRGVLRVFPGPRLPRQEEPAAGWGPVDAAPVEADEPVTLEPEAVTTPPAAGPGGPMAPTAPMTEIVATPVEDAGDGTEASPGAVEPEPEPVTAEVAGGAGPEAAEAPAAASAAPAKPRARRRPAAPRRRAPAGEGASRASAGPGEGARAPRRRKSPTKS